MVVSSGEGDSGSERVDGRDGVSEGGLMSAAQCSSSAANLQGVQKWAQHRLDWGQAWGVGESGCEGRSKADPWAQS